MCTVPRPCEKKAAEMLLLIDGTCDLAQIRDPVALHTTAAEQQHSLVVRTLYLLFAVEISGQFKSMFYN